MTFFTRRPGGVANYAMGQFYEVAVLYPCAEPDAGAISWKTIFGNGGNQDTSSLGSRTVIKDRTGNVYIATRSDTTINGQVGQSTWGLVRHYINACPAAFHDSSAIC